MNLKNILNNLIFKKYNSDKLSEFESLIGYKFQNKELLFHALTHSAKENRNNTRSRFERLEFLGDAILNMIVTEELFKKFPDLREGELSKIKSKIISRKFLTSKALELNLGHYINSTDRDDYVGRKTILGNTMEAVIAAIYLDGRINPTRNFIKKFILHDFKKFIKDDTLKNYKSIIQEYTQKKYHIVPNYKMIKEEGPAHNKIFTVSISINGKLIAYGEGRNKKTAEQNAAKKAFEKLNLNNQ